MSLRVRWTLLLFVVGALGLTASMLAMLIGGLGPWLRQGNENQLRWTAELGRQLDAGVPVRTLERRFGVRIGRHAPAPDCRRRTIGGRELAICRTAPRGVAVQRTRGDWAMVRPQSRTPPVGRRIFALWVLGNGGLALLCWMVAGRISRSLNGTVAAMERVASGELAHRIPVPRGVGVREAAAAFNRMAERVDRMVRAERTLTAGISHELRTPLARLRLELEMLRDADRPSLKRLDAMEADLREIDALLEELFAASKLAWDETRIREAVDLHELTHEVIGQISFQNLTPRVEGSGIKVHGDRRQLVRALSNLLQNADKYGTAGTFVTVRHRPDGFEVEDEGPGVDLAQMDRLFEPFFRVRRGQQVPGLGLGLTVVRQILENHGGTVEARPVPLCDGSHGLGVRCRFHPGRPGAGET